METRHLGCLAAAAVGALALLAGPTRSQAQVSTTGCASASACTLTELFAGGSITVDDKHFRKWGLEVLHASAGAVPNLNLITVSGISSLSDPNPNNPGPGIRFNGNGQLQVNGVQYIDLRLDFRVALIGSGRQIKDASVNLTSFAGAGNAWIRFNQFLSNNTGAIGLGQLVVSRDFAFSPVPATALVDSISFPPQTNEVYSEKNFYLEAAHVSATALIATVDDRYSQLPEPGSLLMLGCGAALLRLLARRRR